MSNAERKENLPAILRTAEPTFTELARRHQVPDFSFARESEFALQILKENDYLAQIACSNPESLKDAIINVAAVGLSLSPVHKLAYLVPRKVRGRQKICLDVSWRGLIYLHTAAGAILWAQAELVYDTDDFKYMGMNVPPEHVFNPFKERGKLVGGFVLAKTSSGDFLVTYMSIADILRIRDKFSESYRSTDSRTMSPWVNHELAMIKKTLIRNASNAWPKNVANEALDRATKILNESDGEEAEDTAAEPQPPTAKQQEGWAIIRELLAALDRQEDAYISHLCRTTNRKITRIEDLTPIEVDQAVTMLQGLVDAQAAKLAKVQSRKESAS